jgi:hypothetical protein
MDRLSELSQRLDDSVIELSNQIPDVFQAPGIAYVLIGAIGLLYMIFGLKVYRFILALIVLSVAGGITYYVTEGSILITVLVGLVGGIVAYLLQKLFMFIISGLVFASIAFLGLYAALKRADIPLLAALVMIGLGIYLAVKLFKFIIIFSTSAIGAACVTGSFWVLYRTGESLDVVTRTVDFDPGLFEGNEFAVAIIFTGCLLLGIVAQSLMLAFTRRPAPQAEEA